MDFLEWICGCKWWLRHGKMSRLSTQNECRFAKVLMLDWCHQYHSYQSTSWGWSVLMPNRRVQMFFGDQVHP